MNASKIYFGTYIFYGNFDPFRSLWRQCTGNTTSRGPLGDGLIHTQRACTISSYIVPLYKNEVILLLLDIIKTPTSSDSYSTNDQEQHKARKREKYKITIYTVKR